MAKRHRHVRGDDNARGAFASPLPGQAPTGHPDPLAATIQAGSHHIRSLFTVAAEEMSDEDYVFKPTPEVRSFGQLLAHVAETNYWFCSTATGQVSPVSEIEKKKTRRGEIQQVLSESFGYCDRAFEPMSKRKLRRR